MVAQEHQCQAAAAVGLAVGGVQPQGLVKVAQGRPGDSKSRYARPRELSTRGWPGLKNQGVRVVVDRAGVVAPVRPGHAADLVEVGPGLAAGQGAVAGADHLVGAIQVEQHHHPQAVCRVEVGGDLQGRIAGRQGVFEAPVAAGAARRAAVVARQHGIPRLLVPDRVFQVAQGRRAMLRRLVVALLLHRGAAAIERRQLGLELDRLREPLDRLVPLLLPLKHLGQAGEGDGIAAR